MKINSQVEDVKMAVLDVKCPRCAGLNVVKHGKLPGGEQRYRCGSPDCWYDDLYSELHGYWSNSRG
ncbi:MAG: IS1 family transposase [Magnetococcales bacterium]|nr:IS1 family transposase [Magnetococcales bacterium]